VVAFTLIQQIENSILTPILTKKFVGLSPALVLLSLAIGGKLWGLLGAILAVPLAGILFEFLKDFLNKKREKEVVVL
jgi:predicted PurR-regulated permease PerM